MEMKMVKKILNVLGILSLVLFVLVSSYMIVTLSTNMEKQNTILQSEISELTDTLSKTSIDSVTRDILTVKSMSNFAEAVNTYADINDKRIDTLILKTKDVDKDLIINGSVFVQSMIGSGSGTIIKKTEDSMYILTCYHVIAPNYEAQKKGFKIGVTIGYSKEDKTDKTDGLTVYGAEIIKADKENDLALLKTSITDKDLNEIKIAEISPEKGDIVYSVGHPLGLMRAISKGILTAKVEGYLISDTTMTYGNSGGGLFNIRGELIGVPSQVVGYDGGLDENGEVSFIPESGLGMSINLLRIKDFLIGTEVL